MDQIRQDPYDTDEHPSRVDWLVEVIGDGIVNGVLQPGEKISEPQLSRRFGISRAPLREAMRRLEERRLVVRKPRLGARVAEFSAGDFVNLFHIREGLEGIAARLAATRITPAEVTALRDHCHRHAGTLSDSDTARSLDLQFHHRIAQISGCGMLTSMLCTDFFAFFRICRRQHARFPGRPEVALRQHLMIVDALGAGDAELAEFLLRKHVRDARRAFEKVLEMEAAATDLRHDTNNLTDHPKPPEDGEHHAIQHASA